ncbi:DUF4340 domain-containing protein [Candidatus Villigracilis saccharophilus]|uniref:DUF4340 domain-containing protein n=1 Tax=Candidatus Villigracilis saccharophilus TaxID=3140684 RepID=UPI0031355F32|nr:DUF4340 domain-containing protein [Anaerolineales bacterium]
MAAKKTTDTPKKRTVSKPKQEAYKPKPVKAKFNAGTWITVLIFIGLVAAAVYINRQKETAAAEATPVSGPSYLFSASVEGNPTSIEVAPAEGEAVKLLRNAENIWALELPREAEADQGLAEAAATQLSALEILSEVDSDPAIFGLDTPSHVISLEFANGKKHTLEVGDSTPTNSGYYVRLDKDKMMIVDLSGIDSLVQLAATPPYLPTPTLEVTVTPTP